MAGLVESDRPSPDPLPERGSFDQLENDGMIVHKHVTLDLDPLIAALDELEPIEEFFEIVRGSQ